MSGEKDLLVDAIHVHEKSMMKIFELKTTAQAEGDLVSFGGDRSGRLMNYFVRDIGDGKFLRFTRLQAKAQELLTSDVMKSADFIDADISIPIFSIKAAEMLMAEIPEQCEFYPLFIDVRGEEVEFRLCKIKVYTNLINAERSSWVTLSEDTRLIDQPVFFSSFKHPFLIARDQAHPGYWAVSTSFVELCLRHGLAVRFGELAQDDSVLPHQ